MKIPNVSIAITKKWMYEMIKSRIIDNDMGAVMKVPLTGRGDIHGYTMILDIARLVLNLATNKEEEIVKKVTVPEIDMGILEMLAEDMGVARIAAHCAEHLRDPDIEKCFVEYYKSYVTPIYLSGKL